jgi:membrane protein DedA with SNARE-associated domain
LWSLVLALAGYLLGRNWPMVMDWVSRYEKVVLLLAVVLVVLFVVNRLRQRIQPRADGTSDGP